MKRNVNGIEIDYTLAHERFYPNLLPPAEKEIAIGYFGRAHLRYIKLHKKVFYTTLLTKGKLNSYLENVDSEAQAFFFQVVKELSKAEGITEKLKEEDQLEWVRMMNNICNLALEIVNEEIVFSR